MFRFTVLCLGTLLRILRASESGESHPTSTTHRTEASASPAKTRPIRQALLGRSSTVLVRAEASAPHRHTLNRGSVQFNSLSLTCCAIPRVHEKKRGGQE